MQVCQLEPRPSTSTSQRWDCEVQLEIAMAFNHKKIHRTHASIPCEASRMNKIYIYINMYIWSRFAVRYHPPPPTWYGPKTCVLQHSAWKRCICSVFFMVGCWCGPQPCKFVGFCNQPSENVLLAMFRLRHRGVVPPRPLLFLCQVII